MRLPFFQMNLLVVLLFSTSACLPGPEWLTTSSNVKLVVSGLETGDRFSFSIANQERSIVKRVDDDVLEFSVDVPEGDARLSASVAGATNRCLSMDVEVRSALSTIALDVTLFPLCDVIDAGIIDDAGILDAGGSDAGPEEDAGVFDAGDDDDDDGGDSEPEPNVDGGQGEDAGDVDVEDAGDVDEEDAGDVEETDAGLGTDGGETDGGETDGGETDGGETGGAETDGGQAGPWDIEKIRLKSEYGDCAFENCETYVEIGPEVLISRGFDDVERQVVLSSADFAFVSSSATGPLADDLFDDGCDFTIDIPQTFLRRERSRNGQDESDEVETTGCDGVAAEIKDRILLLKSLYLP